MQHYIARFRLTMCGVGCFLETAADFSRALLGRCRTVVLERIEGGNFGGINH
jgi:hypothetical protein